MVYGRSRFKAIDKIIFQNNNKIIRHSAILASNLGNKIRSLTPKGWLGMAAILFRQTKGLISQAIKGMGKDMAMSIRRVSLPRIVNNITTRWLAVAAMQTSRHSKS
jgi:hypothetical protein